MFAQSITEEEVNRTGGASQLRYFHTTYGETYGYNERERKYHRSYGLVTPPNNPQFVDYRTGDLATAPLYRRDAAGFRREYPDANFSWQKAADGLKKNQKRWGEEEPVVSSPGPLPPRSVEFHLSSFPSYPPPPAAASSSGSGSHSLARGAPPAPPSAGELAETQRLAAAQAEFEQAFQARSTLKAPERAVLTSSLTEPRSESQAGRNPMLHQADHLNPNLFPLPGLKQSPYNPAFNGMSR